MSRASHNPELYDKICEQAVHKHIQALVDIQGFTISGEAVEAVVDTLLANHKWRTFAIEMAWREIVTVEREYFGDESDE